MGKRVPSVEKRRTDSSSGFPGRPTTRVYLFVAANVVIHAIWMGTSSACCGSDTSSVRLADKKWRSWHVTSSRVNVQSVYTTKTKSAAYADT